MEIIDIRHVMKTQRKVILGLCSCSKNQAPSIFL